MINAAGVQLAGEENGGESVACLSQARETVDGAHLKGERAMMLRLTVQCNMKPLLPLVPAA